jgi:hypothetical protein
MILSRVRLAGAFPGNRSTNPEENVMRKRIAKLHLTRETLRALDAAGLSLADGGSDRSVLPGLCDPSNNSQCDTACLACPLRPPTIEN